MSDPDWPALFRSMQEQLGMLQAEFIQLKDISVSKASLHDTLQLALIAQSRHLGSVMHRSSGGPWNACVGGTCPCGRRHFGPAPAFLTQLP